MSPACDFPSFWNIPFITLEASRTLHTTLTLCFKLGEGEKSGLAS